MLDLTDARALAASFRDFTASSPALAALAERAQAEELDAELTAREAAALAETRRKLEEADEATRSALAPLLRHPPLARLVASLWNDPDTDASAWASNPLVLGMLRRAARLLARGELSEAQLEEALLAHIKAPGTPGAAEWSERLRPRLAAPSPEQLASAMNEQLEERRAGSAAYAAGDPAGALRHWGRGLAVLGLLAPGGEGERRLVEEAKVGLLLNSAAAHHATGAYGAAAEACAAALALDPGCGAAHVRRARALLARREYEAAAADLDAAEALCGAARAGELRGLRAALRAARGRDVGAERALYGRMLGGGR
ncbi:hypothetical protein HYH03_018703 [Edaphochlamys debaryana]|uniref:Uncharacterized protein n=1 Tax=Edaphochlamys debaryana TaxID=47281 RepID=A0A836BP85_9CHLO|nr:hypothetical protein HYH03_018703 [Edaphochlamys debaryana]|eukprot:KAG2482353.1 hypothetical protein HYH03_018703 [Edaphochlamys debaryana]